MKKIVKKSAPKKLVASKIDNGGELMTLTCPADAKEGDVYIVVPAGVFGVERWFKKSQMANISAGKGGILTLTLTRREIAQRDLEHLAKPVAKAAPKAKAQKPAPEAPAPATPAPAEQPQA